MFKITHASRTNIVVEQSFSQESILTPVERLDYVWGITISTIDYLLVHHSLCWLSLALLLN